MLFRIAVTRKLHKAIGHAIKQPHDGIRDVVKPVQRRCREQSVTFCIDDSHRLRNKLTNHNVKRGNKNEANCHRNSRNRCVRQANSCQSRMNQTRNSRLAQPTKCKRSQGDTQLTSGKIGVYIFRNNHCAL